MQQIKSSYGRKGINVGDRTPTRAIRHHLGNVHGSTSFEEVEDDVRAEITQATMGPEADLWTEKLICDTIRFTLWQHAENRAEYAAVMGGAL